MKKIFIIIILSGILLTVNLSAQSRVENYIYAQKDTSLLSMDVYFPDHSLEEKACMIFVFGGGFAAGSKSSEDNVAYFKEMAKRGFVVSAIDYRLGLKGMQRMGIFNLKKLRKAINMAVEDLYSATGFILEHSEELGIDPKMIIANGSSAGAMTVLHADIELSNRSEIASVLPSDFRYAGIISFAGAIFSHNGKPKYKEEPPVPTFFFHGTNDYIVTYNKIQLFNIGLFGSSLLAKRFDKFDYPYDIYRYRGMGHEIATIPMKLNPDDIVFFIEEYIFNRRPLKIDVSIEDGELHPER